MTEFSGYSPLSANFAQVPMEVVGDDELDANAYATLIILSALVAFEQFRRGLGRLQPVPLPWRVVAEKLRLTEDAARDRTAILESLGRIRIFEGPRQEVNGRMLAGPNLFVLRWTDEPVTDRLASRVARRMKNLGRFAKSSKSEPLSALRGSTVPTTECTQGFNETAPLRGSEDPVTPECYSAPSIRGTEPTEKELTDLSVSQSLAADPSTDRPTDGFPDALLDALNRILDPLQIPHVTTGPFRPSEVWAILESIRVYGSKLSHPVATTYNALTKRPNGEKWLTRVAPLFEAAGWREVPEDGTPEADPLRRKGGLALEAQGLRRLPLDIQGHKKRAAILAAVPAPPKAAQVAHVGTDDPEALRVWLAVSDALREAMPPRTFNDWIPQIVPMRWDGQTLAVRASSPAHKQWMEQQLSEDIYDAAREASNTLGFSQFKILFI